MRRNMLLVALLLSVAAWAAPREVWVNAGWTGQDNCGGHAWMVDAFPTIAGALQAVEPGGTVTVAPGRYTGQLIIGKSVYLRGPGAGINPNAPTDADPFAANPQRGTTEAIIMPAQTSFSISDGLLITIKADRVMVDGFMLDGDNPDLKNGVQLNGIDGNAAGGIGNAEGSVREVIIANNILRNFAHSAIYFRNKNGNAPLVNQNIIANNRIDNLPLNQAVLYPTDYPMEDCVGIFIDRVMFEITGNTVTRALVGICVRGIWHGVPVFSPALTRNCLDCAISGISCNMISDQNVHGNVSSTPPRMLIAQNWIRITPLPNTKLLCTGMSLCSIEHNSKLYLCDNVISGGDAGVFVWNAKSMNAGNVHLYGGTISNAKNGVWLSNYYSLLPYPNEPTAVLLKGVMIRNSTQAGLYLLDDAQGDVEVKATIMGGTVFQGGPVGILVEGGGTRLSFVSDGKPSAEFTGQTEYFIELNGNGNTYPPSFDTTAVRFEGKTLNDMTPDERAKLEKKLRDQHIDPRLGRLY